MIVRVKDDPIWTDRYSRDMVERFGWLYKVEAGHHNGIYGSVKVHSVATGDKAYFIHYELENLDGTPFDVDSVKSDD